MSVESIFLGVAIILFIGFFGEVIFKKTKIPDVIWLIIIGIILSSVFKWVDPTAFEGAAPLFTTFALVYLLFEAGLNIDIKKFIKSAPQGLALTFISFVLAFLVTFLIGLAIGKGLVLSLLLGSILGGVSSAVVIPLVKNLDLTPKVRLALVIDSAISDVLCILGTVTIIAIFTTGGFSVSSTINNFLAQFLIAIAIGAALGFLWARFAAMFISKIGNFFMLTLGLMLIVYSLTKMINANGAIACLVFGLVLGNSKHKESSVPEEMTIISGSGKHFFGELSFFIKTFFFVYLGILINFSEPISFLWAFLIVIGIFIMRPFSIFVSFYSGNRLKDIEIADVLVPKGLAAAVLVQLPLQAGIPGAETLVNIVLAVILISIVLSTILVFFAQKKSYRTPFSFLHFRHSPDYKEEETEEQEGSGSKKPQKEEKPSSEKKEHHK